MSTDRYPNSAEVRQWAQSKRAGAGIPEKGRLPRMVILAWNKAHPDRPYVANQAFHGTYGGYTTNECRCARCTAASTEYRRNYDSAGGPDRWDRDAEPRAG